MSFGTLQNTEFQMPQHKGTEDNNNNKFSYLYYAKFQIKMSNQK